MMRPSAIFHTECPWGSGNEQYGQCVMEPGPASARADAVRESLRRQLTPTLRASVFG